MDAEEVRYWARMREYTTARIGIGRVGSALPTDAMLDFQLGFARARDAVHSQMNVAELVQAIAPAQSIAVQSQAKDRLTYLLRPDLGRRLSDAGKVKLQEVCSAGEYDIVFIMGDGLSARAAERYGPEVIEKCRRQLSDLSIAPIVLASQARVALADDIAKEVGAGMSVILLGERPGLTTPESLGIYITWQPKPGTPDSRRNCISNVHKEGFSCEAAANMAVWLIREAARLKISGVDLKENFGSGGVLEGHSPRPPLGE